MWIEARLELSGYTGLTSILINVKTLRNIFLEDGYSIIQLNHGDKSKKDWDLKCPLFAKQVYNALILALMGTSTQLNEEEYVRVIKHD